jgi:hypothetical protein
MNRSYLVTIGWLLAVVLMLHAAMLAGGSHQVEANAPTAHGMHHAAGQMQAMMAEPDAPVLIVPEMSECSLLGVAMLRFEAIATTPAVRSALEARSQDRDGTSTISSPISQRSRAELQVYLI